MPLIGCEICTTTDYGKECHGCGNIIAVREDPQRQMLKNQYQCLLVDCKSVLEGFDNGLFIRNTENDADPGWAIKVLRHVSSLARLAIAVDNDLEVSE